MKDECGGMTDLQFRSFLRQIVRRLETAEGRETKAEVLDELAELRRDLQEDLQG